mmetsp:Transcript_33753/g.77994  ORF Transcript_33753/g.77994 Transcript_33753/m.77994 type:complete len:208 (+) Transcript_33753:2118-2741(+)
MRIQSQANLEGQGEAVQAQGLQEASPLALESVHDVRLTAHVMRVKPQSRKSATGLLADDSSIRHQHTDLAMLQWGRHGLHTKLGVWCEVQLAEATNSAAPHLDLAVDKGVQIELVASDENCRVRAVPQNTVSCVWEVCNWDAIVVHRIVQPSVAGIINQGNPGSFMVWVALSNPIGMLVLIDLLAVYQGVILQSSIGVRVNQEIAHN